MVFFADLECHFFCYQYQFSKYILSIPTMGVCQFAVNFGIIYFVGVRTTSIFSLEVFFFNYLVQTFVLLSSFSLSDFEENSNTEKKRYFINNKQINTINKGPLNFVHSMSCIIFFQMTIKEILKYCNMLLNLPKTLKIIWQNY